MLVEIFGYVRVINKGSVFQGRKQYRKQLSFSIFFIAFSGDQEGRGAVKTLGYSRGFLVCGCVFFSSPFPTSGGHFLRVSRQSRTPRGEDH